MTNLPKEIIQLLAIFSPLFSKPTYQSFLFLFKAHVLCKGRRTITDLLKRMGLRQVKNYSKYHDFFSKAKWSTLNGSKILLLQMFSHMWKWKFLRAIIFQSSIKTSNYGEVNLKKSSIKWLQPKNRIRWM